MEVLTAPYYPKAGNGSQPVGFPIMLRICFLQQWFALVNLNEPADLAIATQGRSASVDRKKASSDTQQDRTDRFHLAVHLPLHELLPEKRAQPFIAENMETRSEVPWHIRRIFAYNRECLEQLDATVELQWDDKFAA